MLTDRLSRAGGLMALCIALTACGAEREEPFNPSEPEEEPGEPVAVSLLMDAQFTPDTDPLFDSGGKRLEVITNLDDFHQVFDAYNVYANQSVFDPDFEQGQVLLYDGGWIDDNACEQQLTLRRDPRAETLGDDEDLVEVSLLYTRSAASSGTDCNDEEILFRPFAFYYIETRADLTLVEEVHGISGGGSGGTSSSNSGNSSSINNHNDQPGGF